MNDTVSTILKIGSYRGTYYNPQLEQKLDELETPFQHVQGQLIAAQTWSYRTSFKSSLTTDRYDIRSVLQVGIITPTTRFLRSNEIGNPAKIMPYIFLGVKNPHRYELTAKKPILTKNGKKEESRDDVLLNTGLIPYDALILEMDQRPTIPSSLLKKIEVPASIIAPRLSFVVGDLSVREFIRPLLPSKIYERILKKLNKG